MEFKNIMIVGANFRNKGAQSMLFITMDEIRKRQPNANIFFMTYEDMDFSNYRFIKQYYNTEAKAVVLNRSALFVKIKSTAKDLIKFLLGRKGNLWQINSVKKIMPLIDIIVDISGFNIGKRWSAIAQEDYLDNIRIAKKYGIPIYLMPQSFGTFDYPEDTKYIIQEIKELFPYPKKIFAREKEGYQLLAGLFGLSNVEQSSDLVLQNKGVSLENIFKVPPVVNVPKVKKNAVGIIPNLQCFIHGDKDYNLEIYKAVIKKLLEKRKTIYLFRHSFEDFDLCKEIYNYVNNESVVVLPNDFSCIEYDEFIKQFDFIVCSRYHGIVHAYRNSVPGILLGWAVKYLELAELLGQDQYAFDITKSETNISDILAAVDKMCNDFKKESYTIKTNLESIQNDNCFDKVFS